MAWHGMGIDMGINDPSPALLSQHTHTNTQLRLAPNWPPWMENKQREGQGLTEQTKLGNTAYFFGQLLCFGSTR
jgi:hypothetical protein